MLYQLQYLRAVAVLAVCYFHLVEVLIENGINISSAFHNVGPVGVDIFFVISGFIMTRIASQRDIRPGAFMAARIRRIVPNYWAATLLVFLLAFYLPHLLTTTTADPIQLLHSLFFIPNGQSNVSNVPTLVVGWTLNYEMFFYMLVALCAGVLRDKTLFSVVLCLIILALVGLLNQSKTGYWAFYTDPIILEFGFGVLVHHIWSKQNKTNHPKIYVLLIIAMSVIILWSKHYYLSDLRPLVWGLPAAVIVFSVMKLEWGASGLLRKIGDWSYEIYIWHVFAIVACIELSVFIFPFSLQAAIAGAICMSLLLAASILATRWISRSSRPIGDKNCGIDTEESAPTRKLQT